MSDEVLMRGSDLLGRPIVDVGTGELVSKVRDVVFDPHSGGLVGVRDDGGVIIGMSSVASIGTHALMVELPNGETRAGALVDPSDEDRDRVRAADQADDEVLGDTVVTESGRQLGTVKDVVVRGGREPKIVAFEVDGPEFGQGLVPMRDDLTMSGSALVVPDEFESRFRRDLTGLAAVLSGDLSGDDHTEEAR